MTIIITFLFLKQAVLSLFLKHVLRQLGIEVA
ncbi:hypothetical protein GGI1_03856 [Acidithiobacillus sp. GGI-221]|nr:hypothetical protein GGI1_03856 [Acidithiobacillus sp. GGI-221]